MKRLTTALLAVSGLSLLAACNLGIFTRPVADPVQCDAIATGDTVWVFVANRSAENFTLEVIGRAGACNWRVNPAGEDGSVGGVTVEVANVALVRLHRGSDCAVVAERQLARGTYVVEVKDAAVDVRAVEGVDLLPLGSAVGPCVPAA